MKPLLFTLLLLLAIPSLAAAEAFGGQAVSPGGKPLSNAIIVVCSGWSDSLISNPTTPCDSVLPKATIYGNSSMTGELGNPLYADVDGRYNFLAPNGEYTISVEKTGYNTYTYEAGSNPSSGATLQTNGTNNTSQTTLNFTNSTANAVGLTITPSNPATGDEKFENTGGNYTGNASTATSLAGTPSQCTGGEFATGVTASGDANCSTPTGSGNVTGPASSTVGDISLFNNTSGTLLSDAGKGVPSGAIVGTTDTQTLSNKTLTSPVINTSASGSGLQGKDSRLLTAGTVSGTGSTLCTDANGGATTSGCSSGGASSYSQSNLATTATRTQLLTVASPSVDTYYLVEVLVEGTTAASGCTTNPAVEGIVEFTDATNSTTPVFVGGNYSPIALNDTQIVVPAYVKGGTNLQAGVDVITAGSGCSTNALVATQIRVTQQ